MLRISLFVIGKLKEAFWKDACGEYLKRLEGYAKVNVRELPDSTLAKEEQALLETLPDPSQTPWILLDIAGKPTSSEGLARLLEDYALEGASQLAFIIGGSDGVGSRIKEQATKRVSFGPITLPHNLARVVLLEQLYRAFKIQRNEPYHK